MVTANDPLQGRSAFQFRDQAVVVSPDVEDHAAVAHDAGLGEPCLDLRGRVPVRVLNRSVPDKSGASALECFPQNSCRARWAMMRTADYIGPIMGMTTNDRK